MIIQVTFLISSFFCLFYSETFTNQFNFETLPFATFNFADKGVSLVRVRSSSCESEDPGYLADVEDCSESDGKSVLSSGGSECHANGDELDDSSSETGESQSSIDLGSEFDSCTESELCVSSGSVSGRSHDYGLVSDTGSSASDVDYLSSVMKGTSSSSRSTSPASLRSSIYESNDSDLKDSDGYVTASEYAHTDLLECSTLEQILEMLETDYSGNHIGIPRSDLFALVDHIIISCNAVLDSISYLESEYAKVTSKPRSKSKLRKIESGYSSNMLSYEAKLGRLYEQAFFLISIIFENNQFCFSNSLLKSEGNSCGDRVLIEEALSFYLSELALAEYYITKFNCNSEKFSDSELCLFLGEQCTGFRSNYEYFKSTLKKRRRKGKTLSGKKRLSGPSRGKRKRRVVTGRKKAIVSKSKTRVSRASSSKLCTRRRRVSART